MTNPPLRSGLRPVISLEGEWDFAVDPKAAGQSGKWFDPASQWPNTIKQIVPGCWEAQGVGEPAMSHVKGGLAFEMIQRKLKHAYTGAGWYRKKVTIPADWAGRQIWLKSGGINAQGWIYVNGTLVAHEWAYCGVWKYNITDLVRPGQAATITVLARNDLPGRRGESNCIRPYGGIFRSIEIESTPAVSIDYVWTEALFDQKKVRVHAMIRNLGGNPADGYDLGLKVATWGGNKPAGAASVRFKPGANTTTEQIADIALDPFLPWSPISPALYKADLVLRLNGQEIDGWVERFGVKQYEVRGGDLFLNNERFLARAGGDDHVYPITVCSPASREEHRQHLRVMRDFGFNYVRHHTHCEIPEYYDAADEVGIIVQPELPYYGNLATQGPPHHHMSMAPNTLKDDLRELVTHYRRYVSLGTYCGGNEGFSPAPLDQELFQLARELDSTRVWNLLDGGMHNTPENSQIVTWWPNQYHYHTPTPDNQHPRILHEYTSMGLNEDPRLEPKHTGGYASNLSLAAVKKFVQEDVGLDWKWAAACFDAGYQLQAHGRKFGIESARIDPFLDGYIIWLMADISPASQNGVLNMFWEPKAAKAEFFRQFNSPVAILARDKEGKALSQNPGSTIYTSGDEMSLGWVISNFGGKPIAAATLRTRFEYSNGAAGDIGASQVNAASGEVLLHSSNPVKIPEVKTATRVTLVAELAGTDIRNTWPIWIFPRHVPMAGAGKSIAAADDLHKLLAPRYPGLLQLASPESATASLIIANSLHARGVLAALQAGKRVLLLSLPGYATLRPGTDLGWWQVSNQAGTAIARHPAFGDFPHSGYLEPGMYRLIGQAERLDKGHAFKQVEPLMVGIGRETPYGYGIVEYPLGFNLYAFQAIASKGRLLSLGLSLRNDLPEAVYLLDQLIKYAQSDKFDPKGTFDLGRELKSPAQHQ